MRQRSRAFALVLCPLFLAVACGGSVTQNSATPTAACARYMRALFAGPCGPHLPDSEMSRLQTTFESICPEELTLPGSDITAAKLDTCASRLESSCFAYDDLPTE